MKIRRSFLAMGTVAATAITLLGTSGAILSPMSGSVAVNGQPVTAGSAIVTGDVVSTSAQGSARMVLPGGAVVAASNTNFRMESVNNASQIRLVQGMVQVSGLLPVAVNARTVVPATSQTRFNVYDLSGKVYVEAVAGTVSVKAGHNAYTVHAGEAVSFNDQTGTAPAASTGSTFLNGNALLGLGIGAGAGFAGGALAGRYGFPSNSCSSTASPSC